MKLPTVKPIPILWLVLGIHSAVAFGLLFLWIAHFTEGSPLAKKRALIQQGLPALKSRIKTETDIENLRLLALASHQAIIRNLVADASAARNVGRIYWAVGALQASTALLIGVAIYGFIRRKSDD